MMTHQQIEPALNEVFGRYVLLERLAQGGMAEIFRARVVGSEDPDAYLVIKRILPHLADDREFIEMFVDEASITVRLNHPNICQLYELGKHDGSYFIVMEFLAGQDFLACQNYLRRARRLMRPTQAAYMVARMCRGLDYAHAKRAGDGGPLGIVHRDISHQNVIVTYDGEVKVIDFGVARARDRRQKTEAGVIKGKFGYMSPEQIRGGELNGQSDVFAAGVVLWELLTNRRLFHGKEAAETLEKVLRAEIEPPSKFASNVTDALDEIVLRALERDQARRYATAGDFVRDLEDWLRAQPTHFGREELSMWVSQVFGDQRDEELEKRQAYERTREAEHELVQRRGMGTELGDGHEPTLSRTVSPDVFEAIRATSTGERPEELLVRRAEFSGEHSTIVPSKIPNSFDEFERATPRPRTLRRTLADLHIFDPVSGPGLEQLTKEASRTRAVARSLAVLAAVAVLGGGLLGARAYLGARPASVELVVVPTDARIEIDGSPHESVEGVVRGQLAPGPHELAVRRPGFRPALVTFELEPNSAFAQSVVLEALPSRSVRFIVDDAGAGALVWVDGVARSLSSGVFSLEVPAEEQRVVEFHRPACLDEHFLLDYEAPQSFELPCRPLVGALTVSSTPAAEVYIDDELVGSTNSPLLVGELAPFEAHTLSFRPTTPGYQTLERTVVFEGAYQRTINVSVPRIGRAEEPLAELGSLAVRAPVGESFRVFLEERALGLATPTGDGTQVALEAGQRRVVFRRGEESRVALVDVLAGELSTVDLPLDD